MRTVLLFGSSANPPTGKLGHAAVVDWCARELRVEGEGNEKIPVDQVWVLPVYRHAFATKKDLAPYAQRLQMAKLGLEKLPGLEGKVVVKDTERLVAEAVRARAEVVGRAPPKLGTVDLVDWLRAQHPDIHFVLALGGDTYADLTAGKWKDGEWLRLTTPIVVLPRGDEAPISGDAIVGPNIQNGVSSTKVRSTTDPAFLERALHPDVLAYIREHRLYAFAGEER